MPSYTIDATSRKTIDKSAKDSYPTLGNSTDAFGDAIAGRAYDLAENEEVILEMSHTWGDGSVSAYVATVKRIK